MGAYKYIKIFIYIIVAILTLQFKTYKKRSSKTTSIIEDMAIIIALNDQSEHTYI